MAISGGILASSLPQQQNSPGIASDYNNVARARSPAANEEDR
jgi:hypothetical protein